MPDQLETATWYGASKVSHVTQVDKRQPKDVIGYRVPMTTEEEQAIWRTFQELAEKDKWSERQYVCIPRDMVVIGPDQPIVPLLAQFAVDTYNAVCMKAGVSEGVTMTSILEFKYVAIDGIYSNYITVEAIDNGISCIYEATVQTFPCDGRKTLVDFSMPPGRQPFTPEFVVAACAGEKKLKEAAEKSELSKPGHSDRKGKGKGNKLLSLHGNSFQLYGSSEAASTISLTSSTKGKKKFIELAFWSELRKQRIEALKDPPSGSGLTICTVIGSYSYWIPLKEFRSINY